MPKLTFNCVTNDGTSRTVEFEPDNLVVSGWTGRDRAAVEHHIEELKELGVAPPSSTPVYYRTGVELCVQTEHLQVLGPDTSGEVEYVLLSMEDGLWFTVGSDQTDRKAEAMGIALSKQLAAKPLATTAWRVDDFAEIWDALMIRSWATINGEKVLYQEAPFGSIMSPVELIQNYNGSDKLPVGTIMMSGTPAAIGGIRPADRFDMEIADKLGTRRITHGYEIEALPVVS